MMDQIPFTDPEFPDHPRLTDWQDITTLGQHPQDELDSPLRQWWTDQAFDEADRTIAKAEEYGSRDLVIIGQTLWRMAGRSSPLPDAKAMELGCLFYLIGKIQRAVEAVTTDRPISDDTWHDAAVYARMAQACRAGVWPLGNTCDD